MNESKIDWNDLKYYISKKQITTIIGPEISTLYLGSQESNQWRSPTLKLQIDNSKFYSALVVESSMKMSEHI